MIHWTELGQSGFHLREFRFQSPCCIRKVQCLQGHRPLSLDPPPGNHRRLVRKLAWAATGWGLNRRRTSWVSHSPSDDGAAYIEAA